MIVLFLSYVDSLIPILKTTVYWLPYWSRRQDTHHVVLTTLSPFYREGKLRLKFNDLHKILKWVPGRVSEHAESMVCLIPGLLLPYVNQPLIILMSPVINYNMPLILKCLLSNTNFKSTGRDNHYKHTKVYSRNSPHSRSNQTRVDDDKIMMGPGEPLK